MTWAIHPRSAAKIRELLNLPDDAVLTIEDLYQAAEIEASRRETGR